MLVAVIVPLAAGACISVLLLDNPDVLPSGHYEVNPHFTDQWKSAIYTAITDDGSFKNRIRETRIKSAGRLGEIKREGLFEIMFNFLIAYHSDQFKDFRRFRFSLSKGNYTEILQSLNLQIPQPESHPQLGPEDTLKAYWDNVDAPQRQENKATWASVSLADSTIAVQKRTVIPDSLTDYSTRRPNNGVVEPRPVFIPSPSPNDLINRQGYVECAILFAVVKCGNEAVEPCYLRVYWEPQSQTWVPWEIVFSMSLKFPPVF